MENPSDSFTSTLPLNEWYRVRFDVDYIYRNVKPPGKEAWSDQLSWQCINRVCFFAADLYGSDEIYIFIDERPESYIIPIEADGGQEFFQELISRRLFDAEMAIQSAKATNEMFCYPSVEKEPDTE